MHAQRFARVGRATAEVRDGDARAGAQAQRCAGARRQLDGALGRLPGTPVVAVAEEQMREDPLHARRCGVGVRRGVRRGERLVAAAVVEVQPRRGRARFGIARLGEAREDRAHLLA